MCCTLDEAELSSTILYAHEIELNGKLVHILGYQNNVKNYANGPNAMILPFPTNQPMGPENIIDTSEHTEILKDMKEALKPRRRSFEYSFSKSMDDSDDIQIFESGQYTVILAKAARFIPEALQLVPENKRPALNKYIFEAYDKWYPDWPIAVCCFEAKEIDAEPLLWWYEPMDTSKFFLPGLDGHGIVPNLNSQVDVDHTIIIGSKQKNAVPVSYSDNIEKIKQYLAPTVVGRSFSKKMANGDFIFEKSNLSDKTGIGAFASSFVLTRQPPPGMPL